MRRHYKDGKIVKVRDINKDGKKEGWEVARAKGMAKGMGARLKFKRGGDVSKRTSPKKGESHRDRMKRNEEFQKIAEEGREKIRTRRGFRKGGDTHVTKEGKTAKKGLWYNIHQKRKRGEKMRKKGAKGAPTAKAIKESQ